MLRSEPTWDHLDVRIMGRPQGGTRFHSVGPFLPFYPFVYVSSSGQFYLGWAGPSPFIFAPYTIQNTLIHVKLLCSPLVALCLLFFASCWCTVIVGYHVTLSCRSHIYICNLEF